MIVVGPFQLNFFINVVKRLLFFSDGEESTSSRENLTNSQFLIDYLNSAISFFIERDKGKEVSLNKTCKEVKFFP